MTGGEHASAGQKRKGSPMGEEGATTRVKREEVDESVATASATAMKTEKEGERGLYL